MFSLQTGKEKHYANTPKAEPNPAGTIWQRREKTPENAPQINPLIFQLIPIIQEMRKLKKEIDQLTKCLSLINNTIFDLLIKLKNDKKSLTVNLGENHEEYKSQVQQLYNEYKSNRENLLKKQTELRTELEGIKTKLAALEPAKLALISQLTQIKTTSEKTESAQPLPINITNDNSWIPSKNCNAPSSLSPKDKAPAPTKDWETKIEEERKILEKTSEIN